MLLLQSHNSDARQSESDEWPPPLIFDVAYGCVAFKAWGVPAFIHFAQGCIRDIYYNHGDGNDGENGDDDDGGGGGRNGGNQGYVGQSEKRVQQVRDRDAQVARREVRNVGRQASHGADPHAPDFADMIMGLWMLNARKGQRQARAMKADRTQEKVRTWLETTE